MSKIIIVIISVALGVALHFLIIKPIEERNARKWCKEHGLIHGEQEENTHED